MRLVTVHAHVFALFHNRKLLVKAGSTQEVQGLYTIPIGTLWIFSDVEDGIAS